MEEIIPLQPFQDPSLLLSDDTELWSFFFPSDMPKPALYDDELVLNTDIPFSPPFVSSPSSSGSSPFPPNDQEHWLNCDSPPALMPSPTISNAGSLDYLPELSSPPPFYPPHYASSPISSIHEQPSMPFPPPRSVPVDMNLPTALPEANQWAGRGPTFGLSNSPSCQRCGCEDILMPAMTSIPNPHNCAAPSPIFGSPMDTSYAEIGQLALPSATLAREFPQAATIPDQQPQQTLFCTTTTGQANNQGNAQSCRPIDENSWYRERAWSASPTPSSSSDAGLTGSPSPGRPPKTTQSKRKTKTQPSCPICWQPFTRTTHLRTHMETHKADRVCPHKCPYPDCSSSFVRQIDLKRHCSTVHSEHLEHECGYCGKLFGRRDTMQRHTKRCPALIGKGVPEKTQFVRAGEPTAAEFMYVPY